ncbi:MAG: hypothetical protein AAGD07_00995, partial [Planctomycetota bacterium]
MLRPSIWRGWILLSGLALAMGCATREPESVDSMEAAAAAEGQSPVGGGVPTFAGGGTTQESLSSRNRPVASLETGNTATQNPGPATRPIPLVTLGKSTGLQLSPDLTPTKLSDFLVEVDRELAIAARQVPDRVSPETVAEQLRAVVRLKLEAARRLIQHGDASMEQQSVGRRGELQGLSHLAALGDVSAAESLQTLAESLKDSNDAGLRQDSRLVLIGFAIEQVTHGKPNAAVTLVSLIETFASDTAAMDVASLMVLGHAKDTLNRFEHGTEADRVREVVERRFANVEDPQIASIVSGIVSKDATSALESLRERVYREMGLAEGSPESQIIEQEEWNAAVDALIDAAPDRQTVGYLAGLSMEMESLGQNALADATYQAIQSAFAEREDPVGREARMALVARQHREQSLGRVFDLRLPRLGGGELSMQDYRGKTVLVPFWSALYPDSLGLLDHMRELVSVAPDRRAIVGVNLDPADVDVERFIEENALGDLVSFRSVSDTDAEIINPVAYEFGQTSLIFTLVVYPEGI